MAKRSLMRCRYMALLTTVPRQCPRASSRAEPVHRIRQKRAKNCPKKVFQNKPNLPQKQEPRCSKPKQRPGRCTPPPLGQHPICLTHPPSSQSSGLRTHPGYKYFPGGRCSRSSKKKQDGRPFPTCKGQRSQACPLVRVYVTSM